MRRLTDLVRLPRQRRDATAAPAHVDTVTTPAEPGDGPHGVDGVEATPEQLRATAAALRADGVSAAYVGGRVLVGRRQVRGMQLAMRADSRRQRRAGTREQAAAARHATTTGPAQPVLSTVQIGRRLAAIAGEAERKADLQARRAEAAAAGYRSLAKYEAAGRTPRATPLDR